MAVRAWGARSGHGAAAGLLLGCPATIPAAIFLPQVSHAIRGIFTYASVTRPECRIQQTGRPGRRRLLVKGAGGSGDTRTVSSILEPLGVAPLGRRRVVGADLPLRLWPRHVAGAAPTGTHLVVEQGAHAYDSAADNGALAPSQVPVEGP